MVCDQKISAVVLNWKRPCNVKRIIEGWRQCSLIDDMIVWNNNPAEPFSSNYARVINCNQPFSLYARFAAASLAYNDCVLIQDDDLLLPERSVIALHNYWKSDPDVLHGIFGRKPKPNGTYASNIVGESEAPILITRAVMTKRVYASHFFIEAAKLEDIQDKSQPKGNGEDIIFSYAIRRHTDRLQQVHRIQVQELPCPHAINKMQNHYAHRTLVMKTCERRILG